MVESEGLAGRVRSSSLIVIGGLLLFVSLFSCVGLPLLVALSSGDGVLVEAGSWQHSLHPDDEGLWTVIYPGTHTVAVAPTGAPSGAAGDIDPRNIRWPIEPFGFRAVGSDRWIPIQPIEERDRDLWSVGTARLEPGRYEVRTPELGEHFGLGVFIRFAPDGSEWVQGHSVPWSYVLPWLVALAAGLGGTWALVLGVLRSGRRG